MKINIKPALKAIGAFALPLCVAMSSCTVEPDESNRFTFTGETVNDFLLHNDSIFSNFNYILSRCGQDRILSSYGEYTCFAPKNEAIEHYIDSLWNDTDCDIPHNGLTSNGLEGLTDSLCSDIALYHLVKIEVSTTDMINNPTATYRTMLGRDITATVSGNTVLVNGGAPIDMNMRDNELVNGYVHAINTCIPRSNRLVSDELEENLEFSIFFEALQRTGLDKALETQAKTLTEAPPAEKKDYYIPTECKKGFTLFAEPDSIFEANGIYSFPVLVEKCKEWYGRCATGTRSMNEGWYDYFRTNNIEVDMSDDYTKENNVVHMFVAYHILKASVNYNVMAFRNNSNPGNNWNAQAYDYYETMLPYTLIKAWRIDDGDKVYLNRYVTNNTLTDAAESPGSASMHQVVFEGVTMQPNAVMQPLNGYIYPLNGILLYDGKVPLGTLNERMRIDALSFLGETMDNGFRGMNTTELTALNSGETAGRVRFPVDYFDNVKVFNGNSTQIDMNINTPPDATSTYSLYKDDSFQGMGVFDFCIKLPPVPAGEYELRVNLDCMPHGTMLQFYLGDSPDINGNWVPLGTPVDMRIQQGDFNDPQVVAMGCVPLNDQTNYPEAYEDRGIETDKVMHTHGYLRGPLSVRRDVGDQRVIRFVSDQYRKILTTQTFEQRDYWLRLKTALDDGNTERKFQIDYVEFCPVRVASNAQYLEDMY